MESDYIKRGEGMACKAVKRLILLITSPSLNSINGFQVQL